MRRAVAFGAPTFVCLARSLIAQELQDGRATISEYAKLVPSEESMKPFKDMRPEPSAGESDDTLRRRLIFQSRYRGMVEMDLLFGSFAQSEMASLDRAQLVAYDKLLRELDNDLFNWTVMGREPPKEVAENAVWGPFLRYAEEHREELLKFR